MNIAEILVAQAQVAGDRAAIVQRGGSVSFAELDMATSAAAADFRAAGIEPGMRVLVFSPMSIDLYVAVIGLFRIGAAAVFVDPSVGRERLNRLVTRVQPDAFVAVPRAHLLRLTSPAIRSIPIKMAVGGYVPGARRLACRAAAAVVPPERCGPETPAIITFTSGSTGEPKAAVRTHAFLRAQHRALVESLALAPGEVDLTTLPIFLLSNLASGLTSVIADADLRAPGAIDPVRLLRQIGATRPAATVASPALLERLATHATRTGVRLDSFQRIFTGGAPVFPRTLDTIADAAPAAALFAVYGSTEAEPIAEIDRREISPADREAMQHGAGLLAGPPTHSIQLRVLPDRWGTPVGPWSAADLERESLGPDAAGEIVVAGDHVLPGYLDGTGDEETKIRIGDRVWHRTGDAGYVDARGRVWLLGRCAAKVRDADGELYPFAVECAASEIPGVRRSAFLLHEGRRTLVVELHDGAHAPDTQAALARLSWARIARVLIAQIPVDKRHNAKVDYPALRKLMEKSAGVPGHTERHGPRQAG
jgi:acyl-CoA synthetase (AMP-forming)/AMP-acid ligase II